MKNLMLLLLLSFGIFACQKNSIQPNQNNQNNQPPNTVMANVTPSGMTGWDQIPVTDQMVFNDEWEMVDDSVWKINATTTGFSGTAPYYELWSHIPNMTHDTNTFVGLVTEPGPLWMNTLDTVNWQVHTGIVRTVPVDTLYLWNNDYKLIGDARIGPGSMSWSTKMCMMYKAFTNNTDTVIYKVWQEEPYGPSQQNPYLLHSGWTNDPMMFKYKKK